jgi:cytochrome oxidase Cu insertion factor (SCO1/SenC/PrrC family)
MIPAGSGRDAGTRPAAAPARVALVVAAAVLVGAAIGAAAFLLFGRTTDTGVSAPAPGASALQGLATWPPGARPAPPITGLRDQTGRLFSLSSLRGQPVALAFFDSYCHAECPLQGRALSSAERTLFAADRPVLVAVSVDPLDTPRSARAAAAKWGLAAVAPWHWVMGTRAQLAPIWREYHVYVGPRVHGDITHTEALILIDRRGYERAGYLWPFEPRSVAHDLRMLG